MVKHWLVSVCFYMREHTLWRHILPFVEVGVCHYSGSHICARTYHTSSLHYLSHFESQQKELNFLSTDHECIVYLPRTNWRSLPFQVAWKFEINFLDSQAKNSLSCNLSPNVSFSNTTKSESFSLSFLANLRFKIQFIVLHFILVLNLHCKMCCACPNMSYRYLKILSVAQLSINQINNSNFQLIQPWMELQIGCIINQKHI